MGKRKKKWYFHTEAFRKRSKRKLSMEDIGPMSRFSTS